MTDTKSTGVLRVKHWDTRALHQFLLANANTPFRWGSFDCCLFAANAIKAMTGVDIADDFRGAYSDQASAFALIKQVTGGTTVADAAAHCATKHGLQEWENPFFAQRGDLVVFKNDGNLVAGIVHLTGRHVITTSENGLVKQPITSITRAWHVAKHDKEHCPRHGKWKSHATTTPETTKEGTN